MIIPHKTAYLNVGVGPRNLAKAITAINDNKIATTKTNGLCAFLVASLTIPAYLHHTFTNSNGEYQIPPSTKADNAATIIAKIFIFHNIMISSNEIK